MRRQYDVGLTAVANLAYQFDHAQARRRIESVCRFVEKDQFWTMNDRLRELGELLHAERVVSRRR